MRPRGRFNDEDTARLVKWLASVRGPDTKDPPFVTLPRPQGRATRVIITAETAEEAGKAAVAGAKPLSQNAYKVQLARVSVKRALLAAAGVKA